MIKWENKGFWRDGNWAEKKSSKIIQLSEDLGQMCSSKGDHTNSWGKDEFGFSRGENVGDI